VRRFLRHFLNVVSTQCGAAALAVVALLAACSGCGERAEWTVMIFMNATSDLDCYALTNFAQMAQFGSGPDFNLVVELGRDSGHQCPVPSWSGVRRFYVEPGSSAQNGVVITGKDADLGDGKSVASFVEWARSKYPARRYGLVVWGHGRGFHLQKELPATSAQLSHEIGGIRSVGTGASGDILYNRDLADSLESVLQSGPLDFLGFDACYMAGLENAFAFRRIGRYLVASENSVSYNGWNYAIWQTKFRKAGSRIEGLQLSHLLIDAFADTHKQYDFVSDLAAMDLGQANTVTKLVSELADILRERLDDKSVLRAIQMSRSGIRGVYGPNSPGNMVDLRSFVEALPFNTSDSVITAAAKALDSQLQSFVLKGYPGGSDNGVSIFFPASKGAWIDDSDGAAYVRRTGCDPRDKSRIEFVCDPAQHWPDFLADYVTKSVGARHDNSVGRSSASLSKR